MLGVLVALAIGSTIGLVRGGSFKRLESVRLKRVPIVFVAVGLQLAGAFAERRAGGRLSFVLTLLAFIGIAWFAISNRREIGMPLIALGALSNFTVIVANGGMPVSISAAIASGQGDPFADGTLVKGAHIPLVDGARLRFLADVIGLRYGTVVSIGDLLIWAGLILLLQQLMVGPRGRHVVA